jgi:hypothetical protein
MKTLRIAGIPAMVILCVGMAVGQDVATMWTRVQTRPDMSSSTSEKG